MLLALGLTHTISNGKSRSDWSVSISRLCQVVLCGSVVKSNGHEKLFVWCHSCWHLWTVWLWYLLGLCTMPNLYSINYFQWLNLESWVIKLEHTPVKRCLQLSVPYNQNLFIKFIPQTKEQTFSVHFDCMTFNEEQNSHCLNRIQTKLTIKPLKRKKPFKLHYRGAESCLENTVYVSLKTASSYRPYMNYNNNIN